MAQVHFTPREIDDVLANPHMGWETFHFTADKDRNLPAWLPSTVHYLRWGWDDVEPRAGEIDFGMIDRTLNAATAAGQTTAFRIMCCSSDTRNPYHPAWLKDIPGGVLRADYGGTPLEVPDLDNARVLEAHLSLIRRLGQKYDADQRISHIDLGSVGWWGEWHMSGSKSAKMPSAETCRKIVDAYLAAFKTTPLVMLIGGEAHTAYACSQGAGWRADCLGDLGGFSKNWCHMRKGYPQWFREANLADAWKRAPVAYESCWDMRRWKQENWPLRYIFNYALATHASFINNKSAPLPDGEDVRPEIERFLKRLGYRIVLRDVSVTASPGKLTIQSTWQNIGSAPCYTPYPIAWRLTRPDGSFVQARPMNDSVSQFMPGSVDLFTPEFIANPPDLPPGPLVRLTHELDHLAPSDYVLSAGTWPAQATKAATRPPLRLAIEGRDADGWYVLGPVTVPGRKD